MYWGGYLSYIIATRGNPNNLKEIRGKNMFITNNLYVCKYMKWQRNDTFSHATRFPIWRPAQVIKTVSVDIISSDSLLYVIIVDIITHDNTPMALHIFHQVSYKETSTKNQNVHSVSNNSGLHGNVSLKTFTGDSTSWYIDALNKPNTYSGVL